LKISKEQLEKVYGGIMNEVNDLRLQIASKSTLSAIDCQGKTFNTNIAKVQAKNVVPMEITFMDNGRNIFILDEFIE
jgi:hypothetical protein